MIKMTLREARVNYFKANGFPEDGGYRRKWVPLKAGPVTLYLFNSEARKRAVPLHDIHHIVTGYKTDLIGEAEIAAWELAAGTHDKYFAKFINLVAVFYGNFLSPRRLFTAYTLGRNSKTLYSIEISTELLNISTEQLREELLPQTKVPVTLANFVGYGFLFLQSLCLMLAPIATLVLITTRL